MKEFAVIDAPGWHGDYVTVHATFATLPEAVAYRRRHPRGMRLVSGCHKGPGDRVPRGAVDDLLSSGAWKVVPQ